ncbi:MAG: response regulator [Chthoniobacteraceae bacterium]
MTEQPRGEGNVLILEDDPGIRRLQRMHLERAGYNVSTAGDIEEARSLIAASDFDLLLLDYQLGEGENGLQFYRRLHAEGEDMAAILVTGFGDEVRILEAMRAGVRDFIPKTANFVELVAPTVARVMQQVMQERRLLDAEAASRAKDNFLATLSHELRTPLTPVAAIVSALRNDPRLPEDIRSDMEMIHRNIALEARLIDDLLDLTRIVRGKLELRLEDIDLRPILEHALKTVCEAEMDRKGVSCNLDLAPVPHPVRVDPARVTQVFWNLLKNALKFTAEDGEVWLRSSVLEESGKTWIEIKVSDNGIGIDPAVLPKIFGAFEQGDRGITRRFGGLGLGLAISKAIVELHGGRISANSEGIGKGATFTVRLPLKQGAVGADRPESTEPSAAISAANAPCHLLLVEDHVDTAEVLARMLRRNGYAVTVAHSVTQALAAMQATNGAEKLEPVEIVVSDLGLPDGSGIDLMASLRDQYPIRGIALSGFGMDDDIRRAIDAGFSRHLTKPVDFASLLTALQEL